MSHIGRRGFLSILATAMVAAGVEVDADKLLWAPGQKTLFLPPQGGWKRSDYLGAIEAQKKINALESALIDAPVHQVQELLQNTEILKAVLAECELRLKAERYPVVGTIVQAGDRGWRAGDQIQVLLNERFNYLHGRVLAEPFHSKVVTKPIQQIATDVAQPVDRRGLTLGECKAMGASLAYNVIKGRMTTFVTPDMPVGCESAVMNTRLTTARLVRYRDYARNIDRIRVDMLGAEI